jgi:hypothetical protein
LPKIVAEVVRLRTVFHGETPNSHEFGYEGTDEFGTTEIDCCVLPALMNPSGKITIRIVLSGPLTIL